MKYKIKLLLSLMLLAACKPMELREMDRIKSTVIVETPYNTITKAEVDIKRTVVRPDIKKTYFWFEKGRINNSQAAYSGKLLHGNFITYDKESKKITESGKFNYGLKTGKWLTWNNNGVLKQSELYKHGFLNGPVVHFDSLGKPSDTLKYRMGVLTIKKAQPDSIGFLTKIKRFFRFKKKGPGDSPAKQERMIKNTN